MRWWLLLAALLAASCAPLLLARPAAVVEEFPSARVRIYTSGRLCRVEVILPHATLQSSVSRCALVPHRPTP